MELKDNENQGMWQMQRIS